MLRRLTKHVAVDPSSSTWMRCGLFDVIAEDYLTVNEKQQSSDESLAMSSVQVVIRLR